MSQLHMACNILAPQFSVAPLTTAYKKLCLCLALIVSGHLNSILGTVCILMVECVFYLWKYCRQVRVEKNHGETTHLPESLCQLSNPIGFHPDSTS